jgi:hypothetical protein
MLDVIALDLRSELRENELFVLGEPLIPFVVSPPQADRTTNPCKIGF